MRLSIETEFEVGVLEMDNGRALVQSVSFPGCKQNLYPYLAESEKIRLQAELECAIEQATIAKANAIRERKELHGDYRRELALDLQREELASRAAQRGVLR